MHRVQPWVPGILLIALLVFILAACQSPTPTPVPTATPVPPTATPVPPPTPTPTATPRPPAPTPTATPAPTPTPTPIPLPAGSYVPLADAKDIVQVRLLDLSRSGQTGWAVLTAKGPDTEVVVRLSAGRLESEAIHIHVGTCAALGAIKYPLTNLSGGTSVTTVKASLATLLTADFAINAHQKGDLNVYTACGNIPSPKQYVTVALTAVGATGVRGFATLLDAGVDTDVIVQVTRAAAGTESETLHIHEGTCGAALGAVTYPLVNLIDNVSATRVAGARLSAIIGQQRAVNVHNKATPTSYTACGNLPVNVNVPTAAASDVVLIALNERSASGQKGWASLVAKGADTEVTVVLSAGKLASEANHIHASASCDPLGGVAYPLTNLVGGRGTTTVKASLATLLTGGFAINTHQQGAGAVYTTCGELPAAQNTVTVALAGVATVGSDGYATLTARGQKTEVVALLSRGNVESETMSLNSGNCAFLGLAQAALTNLASGASSTLVDFPYANIRSALYAVNVGQKGKPAASTSCGSLALGPAAIAPANVVLLRIEPQNDSGQRGWARLATTGDNTLVTVSVTGGSDPEAIHIHDGGSCDNVSSVVYPLTNASAGISVTTIKAKVPDLLSGKFVINLHKKGGNAVEPADYTSCGRIPPAGEVVTLAMGPQSGSLQRGHASVITRGGTTDIIVVLALGGLESEAIHVHESNDCRSLGGVRHTLTNLAFQAGWVVSATVVDAPWGSLRTTKTAINSHQKGKPEVYTACASIPAP